MIYKARTYFLVIFIILISLLIILIHFLLSLPLLTLAILGLIYYFVSRSFIKIKQYLREKLPRNFANSQSSVADTINTIEIEAEIVD